MTRQTRTSVDPAASITWVVLCESIFRDQNNRMSLLGVASDLPVPSLPLVLAEHLVVARVSRTPEPQELDVMFGVVTPAGLWVTPIDEAATVAVSGDFLIIRCGPWLRDEASIAEVALWEWSSASVEAPVRVCAGRPPSDSLNAAMTYVIAFRGLSPS